MVKKSERKSNQRSEEREIDIRAVVQKDSPDYWLHLRPEWCRGNLATMPNFTWLQAESSDSLVFCRPIPSSFVFEQPLMGAKFYTSIGQDMDFKISVVRMVPAEWVQIEVDVYALHLEDWNRICCAYHKVPLVKGLQTVVRGEIPYHLRVLDLSPSSSPAMINQNTKVETKVKVSALHNDHGLPSQLCQAVFEGQNLVMYGPKGVGKTYTLERFVQATNLPIVTLYEIEGLETAIKEIDFLLKQADRCLFYIRHVDRLAPREATQEQAKFVQQVNGLCKRVSIVASAVNISDIYTELHFKHKVPIGIPADRRLVIGNLWPFSEPIPDNLLSMVVDRTQGYLPGDLERIVSYAMAFMEDRQSQEQSFDFGLLTEALNEAVAIIPPSLLGDYRTKLADNTSDSWDSLGGLFKVKQELIKYLELPLTKGKELKEMGLTPPRGILLHGPPGCSKTTIAKAIARKNAFTFCTLSPSQIFSSLVGESERLIREVFAQARLTPPAIVFIDELDGVVQRRSYGSSGGDIVSERILATLLNELDGVGCRGDDGVMILAATNRLDVLDEALVRAGRFDVVIEVGLPDCKERVDIIQLYCRQAKLEYPTPDIMDQLIELSEGWSGADLKKFTRQVAHSTWLREIQRCKKSQ